MSHHYVMPYVPGETTPQGWSVVCVPGMKAVTVVEPLASRLAHLVITGRVTEARGLLCWFGGQEDTTNVEDEPLPI